MGNSCRPLSAGEGRLGVSAASRAREVLDGVIEGNNPSHVFALFSGGHDSLCSTFLASSHPRFTGVVHVNTEIGVEGTREFVRETCRAYGWPLLELRPPRPPFRKRDGSPWGEEGQTAYEAMVCRWGFPGPKGHTVMYNRLKERCLRQLLRDHNDPNCRACKEPRKGHGKPGSKSRARDHAFEPRRVVLVTGVRRQESKRRMGHIVAEQIEERRVWCAPLVDWGDEDKREYIRANGLPENQIAKRLCMSGECLCGAFARPEELAEIRAVSPGTYDYIRGLEALARSAGLGRCKWGEKPPPGKKRKKDAGGQRLLPLPLCVSCEERYDDGEGE